jgi:hypothetical protein
MNRPPAAHTVNIDQFRKINGSGAGDHMDIPALAALKNAISEMAWSRYIAVPTSVAVAKAGLSH